MAKLTCAIVSVLCLLVFACKNQTSENKSVADKVTSTRGLPTVPAPTDMPSGNTLRIRFHGLVAHMVDASSDMRAVVPSVTDHPKKIVFPDTLESDLEKAFTKAAVKCDGLGHCAVELNGMAFRVVDANGTPGGAFTMSRNFADDVTHLTTIPGVGNTFDKGNLKGDVFATPPPKGSDIAGIVELAGGQGDAFHFKCRAMFTGEVSFHTFPSDVIVDYPLTAGSKLQVFKAGDADWSNVTPLTGPIFFTVDNENPAALGTSHFQSYTLLSTVPVTLPNIKRETEDCGTAHGDVPGCSDSQWP